MDPPKFKNLTLEVVDGAIAIITLRREFSANSLHPDLLIVSPLTPCYDPESILTLVVTKGMDRCYEMGDCGARD